MSKSYQGIWRYQLPEAYHFQSPHLQGIEFANHWVTIMDAEMVVSKLYAWDGCSPTYYVPVFGWVGTPDGKRDEKGIPQSYHASLVHDVLCQFRREIPVTKHVSVTLFKELLLQGGFHPQAASLYAWFVKLWGPQDFLGDELISRNA